MSTNRAAALIVFLLLSEYLQDPLTKIREIVGLTAGNEVTIHYDGSVFPESTRVLEIILDTERTGNTNALVYLGGDWDPAAVAHSGNKLFVGCELPYQFEHFGVAT